MGGNVALRVEVNMAALAAPLSSPTPLFLILSPKSLRFISPKCSFSPSLTSALESPATHSPRRRSRSLNFPSSVPQKLTESWRISAAGGIFSLSEAIADAIPEEIVPASGDGVSTVISALLFTAFIGLSILTIGVIYIAVTDFLQKRERDKFEKEEAAQKKKTGKRSKIGGRARAGPRGFGQKIEEGDDDNDTVAAD